MTQEEKVSLKLEIEKELQKLNQQIEQLQSKSVTIAKDCSLDALNKIDMHYEHQREYKVQEQTLQRIALLEQTLQQINDDEYGVCLECEEDISYQRLLLIPESKYCVQCLNELGK
jgi:DnaK suppressor protein